MKQQLKAKFPEWYKDMSNKALILTNDLDSYFSCLVLRQLFGCEIKYFYDFDSLYHNGDKSEIEDVVGVDLAIEYKNTKTLCNHVTRISKSDTVNPNSININNAMGIHRGQFVGYNYKGKAQYTGNYTTKYAGSTIMMILSLFGAFDKLKLKGKLELTETQKRILMSVDSWFWGYYVPWFRESWDTYNDLLETDQFKAVLDNYTLNQMLAYKSDEKLDRPIEVVDLLNEYRLKTYMNIDLLKENFPMLDWDYLKEIKFTKQFPLINCNQNNKPTNLKGISSKHDLNGRVFSFAVTGTSEGKITKY